MGGWCVSGMWWCVCNDVGGCVCVCVVCVCGMCGACVCGM